MAAVMVVMMVAMLMLGSHSDMMGMMNANTQPKAATAAEQKSGAELAPAPSTPSSDQTQPHQH